MGDSQSSGMRILTILRSLNMINAVWLSIHSAEWRATTQTSLRFSAFFYTFLLRHLSDERWRYMCMSVCSTSWAKTITWFNEEKKERGTKTKIRNTYLSSLERVREQTYLCKFELHTKDFFLCLHGNFRYFDYYLFITCFFCSSR